MEGSTVTESIDNLRDYLARLTASEMHLVGRELGRRFLIIQSRPHPKPVTLDDLHEMAGMMMCESLSAFASQGFPDVPLEKQVRPFQETVIQVSEDWEED